MKRRRVVNVTQADIADGVPGDPHECAIAKACERSWAAYAAYVDPVGSGVLVTLYNDAAERIADIRLGRSAQAWLKAFDDGQRMKPKAFMVLS